MPKTSGRKMKRNHSKRRFYMRRPHIHSVNEEHVMKMENGKVLVNDWIRKTMDDSKIRIRGRVNHKKINVTRKLVPPKPVRSFILVV